MIRERSRSPSPQRLTQKERNARRKRAHFEAATRDALRGEEWVDWRVSQGSSNACAAVSVWSLLRINNIPAPSWRSLYDATAAEHPVYSKSGRAQGLEERHVADVFKELYGEQQGWCFCYAAAAAVVPALVKTGTPFTFGRGGHSYLCYTTSEDGEWLVALNHMPTATSSGFSRFATATIVADDKGIVWIAQGTCPRKWQLRATWEEPVYEPPRSRT